jgi:hypothetical protein
MPNSQITLGEISGKPPLARAVLDHYVWKHIAAVCSSCQSQRNDAFATHGIEWPSAACLKVRGSIHIIVFVRASSCCNANIEV